MVLHFPRATLANPSPLYYLITFPDLLPRNTPQAELSKGHHLVAIKIKCTTDDGRLLRVNGGPEKATRLV